jgi:hypothetical protein
LYGIKIFFASKFHYQPGNEILTNSSDTAKSEKEKKKKEREPLNASIFGGSQDACNSNFTYLKKKMVFYNG